jgi:hypothetical protein
MKKSCLKQECGTQYSITLLRKERGEKKKGETERGDVEKKKILFSTK